MAYVIGTAGHVDHGKSALVEALTGIHPDRLTEEQEREMTIDLGFAWIDLPSGRTCGIVDVPGHRDFIENMLAGVGGIDLALLVIAADEGVMPQTREHAAILDLLEIPGCVIALTKIDLIDDPEWIDLVSLEIEDVFAGTVVDGAPIVPVSSRTGAGLEDLIRALDDALGNTLPRVDRGQPYLPVDRVFTMSGFGTVVTGTLTGGSFGVGDEVEIAPQGIHARIRGLQSHKEALQRVGPGSRVAINLSGVSKDMLSRGNVVCLPGSIEGTTLADTSYLHLPDAVRVLKHNDEVKFFSGAAESIAHVRLVGDRELEPGHSGWLQIRLAEPVALQKGDRFILRYPSPPQTIGGGVVLDPHPPHRWRRFKSDVITRFETLSAGTPEELALHTLGSTVVLTQQQLAAQTGIGEDELSGIVNRGLENGDILSLGDLYLISQNRWAGLAKRLTGELETFHRQRPLRKGMPREALRSRLDIADGRLFGEVVEKAAALKLVVDAGAVVALPGHEVRFTPAQQARIDVLMQQFNNDPVTTPSVKEVQGAVGEDVLQALVERGDLVQVSGDVLFTAETYEWLVGQVTTTIHTQGSITVAEARDLLSTSRKYVLGLLEHLDEIGLTRREGDGRVLRQRSG
nr:selenocysteine-specific translation elongation factor [Anaerolineae bacterium]